MRFLFRKKYVAPEVTQDDVLASLREITDQGKDIVSAGLVSGLKVDAGKVGFLITVDVRDKDSKAWLQKACEEAVGSLPGVDSVVAVMTAETAGPASASPASAPPARKAVWHMEPLPHVKRVIAVASGKGGVGKSTTAVNLAHALARAGKRVGLLDADIYGPSLPRMMGLSKKPDIEDGKMMPIVAYGIACMSIGLMIGEETAIIWRGPQATKALQQMLRDVAWGTEDAPLDVLLIDMPPGTGDVHLSLAQQVPVNGAVIVTTPQDVAVADARKSVDMFRKVNIPVLGIIENMSSFTDPVSGNVHRIFGAGGGIKLAEEAGAKLLGEVPIIMHLREAADNGARYKDIAQYYEKIAAQLIL